MYLSLLYKAENPYGCHAHISVVSASIKTELARNESSVFWDHGVYFCNSTHKNTHRHQCMKKGTDVTYNTTYGLAQLVMQLTFKPKTRSSILCSKWTNFSEN